MQALGSVLGRWRRWARRHWALGVDDNGSVVRWVCLTRQRSGAIQWAGAGQWRVDSPPSGGHGFDAQHQGLPLAMAVPACTVWQRHLTMPSGMPEDDVPTWARAVMAQTMQLPVTQVAVDWGVESSTDAQPRVWLAGVRSSVLQKKEAWAEQQGAVLGILETQSSALERVLSASVQGQTDPVWLWWAGRDEGRLCTGWWHAGQWHDRQELSIDLHHLDQMPNALLSLVRTVQSHKCVLSRMQWWWLGDALAPWAERWAADPPAGERDWVCRAAPMPFAHHIEADTGSSAQAWAIALGLAMHPGWR